MLKFEEENKLSQYFIDEIKSYEINGIVNTKKNMPDEPACEPIEDELDFPTIEFKN